MNDQIYLWKKIEAQFAGYALRLAPNDDCNDIIFKTIHDGQAAAKLADEKAATARQARIDSLIAQLEEAEKS